MEKKGPHFGHIHSTPFTDHPWRSFEIEVKMGGTFFSGSLWRRRGRGRVVI